MGRGDSIRARLLAQLAHSEERGRRRATHYSWEITRDPRGRAAELVSTVGYAE
jgi:hypothetical protein